MTTLERAIEIAAKAHAGQTDKAGGPYILHVLRVTLALSTPSERIAAALHDVVGDTDITIDQLRAEGFGEDILVAVEALTKRTGERRIEAGARAAADPIARLVKLADVADNEAMTRAIAPSPLNDIALAEYVQVRALLQAAGVPVVS